jgi:hypothetical protein
MVEQELTGVDIMPFAAHLTALNLTMQSPLEVTNRTRIGIGNSLHLEPGQQLDTVGRWLREFGREITALDLEGREAKGERFKLQRCDVVIMNPPFTRKERLLPEMKGFGLSLFGEQNYWAYFIALADSVLKRGGKIAAVLPRDFFRGEYSRRVRRFLFENRAYSLNFIVKSVKEPAFSEQARFRDFLVILQKGGPSRQCGLVYLKKRLDELSIHDAAYIGEAVGMLEEGKNHEDETVAVIWKGQEEIWDNWRDLGSLVVFNTPAGERLTRFYQQALAKAGNRVIPLEKSKAPSFVIRRGLEPIQEHLQDFIFIVRPIERGRTGRSRLILLSDEPRYIVAQLKGTRWNFRLPKTVLCKGVKTPAYLPLLDISEVTDFAILKPFPESEMEQLRHLTNLKKPVDFGWVRRSARNRLTHLAFVYRFDFTAPGTRALAYYSDEVILPGKAFWCVTPKDLNKSAKEISKALCIWLNSSISFIEFLLLQRETRGSYIGGIDKYHFVKFHIPNFAVYGAKELIEAFENLPKDELPSLVEQFQEGHPIRSYIDRAVLKFIGYTEREIEVILPDIYEAMATELQSFKEIMRAKPAETKPKDVQLPLI